MCGSWGAITGSLRFFADKFGVPRAAIEGTQIPPDVIRAHATRHPPRMVFEPTRRERPFALEHRVTYAGFELERDREPIETFPPEMAESARLAFAEALARGEARHQAVPRNRSAIDELREVWRRSGGTTASLSQADLAGWYAKQLAGATDLNGFRSAPLQFDAEDFVPRAERERWLALPSAVVIRDRTVALHYEVEQRPDGGAVGVARLQLPEKLARTLVAEELPALDRPLRFVVTRGPRGAVRADSFEALVDALDEPFTPDERKARRQPFRRHR